MGQVITKFVFFFLTITAGSAVSDATKSNHNGELYLFAFPSASSINWSSPQSAIFSVLASQSRVSAGALLDPKTKKSLVGHAAVHFRCRDQNGDWQEEWASLTGQNDPEVDQEDLMTNKIGLSVLFKNYVDGEVEEANYLKQRIFLTRAYRPHPQFQRQTKYLKIALNPEKCSEVSNYYQEFKKRSFKKGEQIADRLQLKNSELLYFGFPLDPYESYMNYKNGDHETMLGGGCASFAVGFLKVAGFYEDWMDKKFKKNLKIGDHLMGGEWNKENPENEVSLAQVMTSLRWAYWREEKTPLSFYDPTLMWSFINKAEKCAEKISKSKNCLNRRLQNWLEEKNALSGQFSKTVPLPNNAEKLKSVTLKGVEFKL